MRFLDNDKTHHLYSDKFSLHVLDLRQVQLATDEDKEHRIEHWARLFKATTWEELKRMAQDNRVMSEAVSTVYKLSQDEIIQRECEAREQYYAEMRDYREALQQRDALEKQLAQSEEANSQLAAKNDQLATENNQLTTEKDQLTTEKDQLAAENNLLTAKLERLYAFYKKNNILLED